jgi:hypothetical protein
VVIYGVKVRRSKGNQTFLSKLFAGKHQYFIPLFWQDATFIEHLRYKHPTT